MKILITDDSPMTRKQMKSMIEQLGHSVITATNGKEAIEVYKEEKPDIVTMDLSMPLMNGLEALKILMEIDPHARVIMSTANNLDDLVLQSMKEGASGYIIKPIKIEVLEESINQVINDIKIADRNKKNGLPEDLE